MRVFKFEELSRSDLVIDAIYEGGSAGNTGDDPINKLLPVGNQGGFRYFGKIDSLKCIVLYSSTEDKDWPDTMDYTTGIFKYYGDNKTPGHELHDTTKKGNLILKRLFDSLYDLENPRSEVPPIFIFQKHPTPHSSRSVQYKGLCVPGVFKQKLNEDLVAVWKSKAGFRFQNYAAFFTVLNIPVVSREWIQELSLGKADSPFTPSSFSEWKAKGKYNPLTSERAIEIRSIVEQLPKNDNEHKLLDHIFRYFEGRSHDFEFFAADVFMMTDANVIIDEVTRGVIDGGRDAIGRLKIGLDEDPIFAEFALEAKCYNPGLNGGKINAVGVKETSRLISRIRNRQFGVLVCTSAISKQAYEEVRMDQHPIIFIGGGDIVRILIEKGINSISAVDQYLSENFPSAS